MANCVLTLAVAGSRKTQGIVEDCAKEPTDSRILVLTYTTANQKELKVRLNKYAGNHRSIVVQGWFAFLINEIVRPYLPYLSKTARVRGFDFDSKPQRYKKVTDYSRYFNDLGQVRKVHLAQLADIVIRTSQGAVLDRLSRLYDRVFIDEVQDLCGYDLEILESMLGSGMSIEMVGDVRQATLVTNVEEKKNEQYKFMKIWEWFRKQEGLGNVTIQQRRESWRCRPEICAFADSLFSSGWGFEESISKNDDTSEHDGLFGITPEQLEAYIRRFSPLVLRHSMSSHKEVDVECMNIGVSKGLTCERVLILPTKANEEFLQGKKGLSDPQAAELYVAVTRARQSVAFLVSDPNGCSLQPWNEQ